MENFCKIVIRIRLKIYQYNEKILIFVDNCIAQKEKIITKKNAVPFMKILYQSFKPRHYAVFHYKTGPF